MLLSEHERLIVIKTPEEIRAADLKRLENFRWIDDTFARTAFRGEPELAQFVLRIITGIADLEIDPTDFDTQFDAKRLAGSRSLMLDVKGGDTKGRKYDLEMEKSDARPERTEVHVATMVTEHMHEGDDFSDLPEIYVIFMCEHDEVGNDRAVNSFSYRNDELYLSGEESAAQHASLGGKTHILYVNGDFRDDSTEIGKLIHDFKCRHADDMYFQNLAARMRELKENREGVDTMCEAMEKEKIRVEEEKTLIMLLNFMKTTGWDAETVMTKAMIPASERDLYARSIAHAQALKNVSASNAQY